MNTKPNPAVSMTIVPIVLVTSEEQKRRIEAAISERAYEIFQKRGGRGWHELEDWQQAECELRSHLCFGMTTEDQTIIIRTDAGEFVPGSLEIWAAPQQLTISGRYRARRSKTPEEGAHAAEHRIFRSITLQHGVDCLGSRAQIHNCSLEIRLKSASADSVPAQAGQQDLALAARK